MAALVPIAMGCERFTGEHWARWQSAEADKEMFTCSDPQTSILAGARRVSRTLPLDALWCEDRGRMSEPTIRCPVCSGTTPASWRYGFGADWFCVCRECGQQVLRELVEKQIGGRWRLADGSRE